MLKDLFPKYKQKIQQTALDRYPEECVLVITNKSGIYEVTNISKDPENSFSISRKDTEKAFEDGLLAVIHSHPDAEPVPSSADMTYQRQCNVPFGIVSTDGERVTDVVYFGDQVEYELENRPFIHGHSDCYGLIRDFYKRNLCVHLPQFDRDWEWWLKDDDLYMENVFSTGFKQVDEPEYGDMFFARVMSDKINHAGIYLGDELILHHLTGTTGLDATRLPRKEPIHSWLKRIDSFWRYDK